MKGILGIATMAIGLACASSAITGTARAAEVGVSLDIGNVAFGYQDGYWDRGHRWHHWRNQREVRYYRQTSGAQYHAWRHDRDADHGWTR
jgi:hypothetical protein